MKRQRGRGRKPGGGGGHQPNRTFDSTGPDVKVRGAAAHVYEKYLQLARDASGAGDRVMAENYLQHAEHYFRMMRAMQPAAPAPSQAERTAGPAETYGEPEDAGADDAELDEEEPARSEQPQPSAREAYGHTEDREGRSDDRRPRRPRRSRYRAEGGEREEGVREPRAERPDRPERPERAGGEESGAVEGFGDAAPAFLGGD